MTFAVQTTTTGVIGMRVVAYNVDTSTWYSTTVTATLSQTTITLTNAITLGTGSLVYFGTSAFVTQNTLNATTTTTAISFAAGSGVNVTASRLECG